MARFGTVMSQLLKIIMFAFRRVTELERVTF